MGWGVWTPHSVLKAASVSPRCILWGLSPWAQLFLATFTPGSPPLAGSSEMRRGDGTSPMGFFCSFPPTRAGTREVLPLHGSGLVPWDGVPQGVRAMLKMRVGALQVIKYPSPSFSAREDQAEEG